MVYIPKITIYKTSKDFFLDIIMESFPMESFCSGVKTHKKRLRVHFTKSRTLAISHIIRDSRQSGVYDEIDLF